LRAVQLRSLKGRVICFVFIEQVKDRALHRIEGNNFNGFAVVDFADIDIVVEVESSRMVRRDFFVLETGLREDECLRVNWHLQQSKDGLEVTIFGLILQPRFFLIELLLQFRHRIAQIFGSIVDWRIAVGDIPLIPHGDLRVQDKPSDTCDRDRRNQC